jgi:hypothetical protein
MNRSAVAETTRIGLASVPPFDGSFIWPHEVCIQAADPGAALDKRSCPRAYRLSTRLRLYWVRGLSWWWTGWTSRLAS